MVSKVKRRSGDRKRHKKPAVEDDSESDDMDLEKDLHPIGYYINDREEMLNQVFKIVKGPKLKAMLNTVLREMDIEEVKQLCLEQLEGMSKKRLRFVLAGKEMDESSATEDEDDQDEPNVTENTEDFPDGELRNLFKNFDGNKEEAKHEAVKSEEIKSSTEDEDLDKVINKKRGKTLVGRKAKKLDVRVKRGHKRKAAREETKKDGEGKTLMELLELEMRAKAIKSLLSKKEAEKETVSRPESKAESLKDDDKNSQLDLKEDKATEVEEDVNELDSQEKRKIAEEELRLQKARDVLTQSEVKKREEEEEIERRHAEFRKKAEEQQRIKDAAEQAAKKKQEELEAKEKAKVKKQEEHKKFLKWREKRRQQALEDREKEEREEQEWKRRNIRDRQERMKDLDRKRQMDRDEQIKSTEMKRKMIDREEVEDDLDRQFEVSIDYGSEDGEEKPKQPKKRRRRYRRKAQDEEGELVESDFTEDSDANKSEISLSPSEHESLAESENDERLEKLRQGRRDRVKEIKKSKKTRKPEEDIEDGEVDSDGERISPIPKKNETEEVVVKGPDEQSTPNEKTCEEKGEQRTREINPLEDLCISMANPEDEGQGQENMNKVQVEANSEKSEAEKLEKKDQGVDEDAKKDFTDNKSDKTGETSEMAERLEERAVETSTEPFVEDKCDEESLKLPSKRIDPVLLEQRRAFLESKPPTPPVAKHPLRKSDDESNDPDSEGETEETFEERAVRKKREKEERKKQKKLQEQREKRFKRMQAFQARSGMQDFLNVSESEEEKGEEEESKTMEDTKDETKKEEVNDFYKSYEEEQERLRLEEEKKKAEFEVEKKEEEDEKNPPAQSLPPPPGKKKKKKKTTEEKTLEGVGFWARKCESEGAFEVEDLSKEEQEMPVTRRRSGRLNPDLPTKEEVDAEQEAMEGLTWADRWYQNKKVQKVVKHSKMLSKVKANIKIKLKDDQPSTSQEPVKPAPAVEALPDMIGSIDEYAKLVGKTKEEVEKEQEESGKEDEESDEDVETDDLWGAIMNK